MGDMIEDAISTANNVSGIIRSILEYMRERKRFDPKHMSDALSQQIEEICRENLLTVLEKAQDYTDERIENIEIQQDWLIKFIDTAQKISNGDMQDILARILSEKMSNRRSCSLRTLSVLSELSHDECMLFSKLMRYSLKQKDGVIYLLHPDVVNMYAEGTTSYLDHLRLSECGLTSIFDSCYRINAVGDACLIHGRYVGIIKTNGERIDSCCLSSLTTAGLEIAALLERYYPVQYDLGFFRHALHMIGNENQKEVSLHRLVRYDSSGIDYLDQNLMQDQVGISN